MLTLYKVTFSRRHAGQFQAVLVSERTQRAATARARAFLATHYTEHVTRDSIERICATPDDVLDWV